MWLIPSRLHPRNDRLVVGLMTIVVASAVVMIVVGASYYYDLF